MIRIEIQDQALRIALDNINANLVNTEPMMRSISASLRTVTQMNIRNQKGADGQPFAALSDVTKEIRSKRNRWPGQILVVDNNLNRSITPHHTRTSASVGTVLPYAMIHQFGGNAGRNHQVTIPARPYLPFVGDKLQEGLEGNILRLVTAHLSRNL